MEPAGNGPRDAPDRPNGPWPLPDNGPRQAGPHVYVHVPFCRDRCTYCAFATHANDAGLHQAFVDALTSESGRLGTRTGVQTLYLGGGTPALLHPDHIGSLIDGQIGSYERSNAVEVTLEANPVNITVERLASWADSRITRISVGIQTFDDGVLSSLARLHSGADARRALGLLADSWPHSWSADLLVGWGGQTLAKLRSDLDDLLAFDPPHVSVYGLTVEPRTALDRLARQGKQVTVEGDDWARLDQQVSERLAQAGLERYEVSNHARPGFRSQHNQAYWRGHDYLGLGPGSSSSQGAIRWSNRRETLAWIAAANSQLSAREHVERLQPEQRLLELLGSGLRTLDGLKLDDLDARFSEAWRSWVLQPAAPLLAAGVMLMDSTRLRIAPAELSRADRILTELVSAWPNL